jgi:flagellar basal-body rod protein FlgB
MDASTAILTVKALDGLAARANATSENIANAGTRGYRPLRVSFEDALRRAADQGDAAVQAVTVKTDRVPIDNLPSGGELRLDLEMGATSTTALRYGALITLLGREMQLDSLAMTGNG